MFAMSQHPYAYAAAAAAAAAPVQMPPPTRQYSGTSSAFSSSANPDEDWTKISDLAERRRIQNRIAQRNYRKKLKRRLEDLERRAGSSDDATSETANESCAQSPPKANISSGGGSGSGSRKSSSGTSSKSTKRASTQQLPKSMPTQAQFTPPMCPDDDFLFPPATFGDQRDRSHSPPMFAYSTYPPPPEDLLMNPYHAGSPFRPVTTAEAAAAVSYGDYLSAAAVTQSAGSTAPLSLPSMTHFTDMFGGYVTPGIDMGGHSPYDNSSNPHTPPLSHSFDHSANCSDSGYEYPTTPLSMPGSPGMVTQHL